MPLIDKEVRIKPKCIVCGANVGDKPQLATIKRETYLVEYAVCSDEHAKEILESNTDEHCKNCNLWYKGSTVLKAY